jgi:hypothetical protein
LEELAIIEETIFTGTEDRSLCPSLQQEKNSMAKGITQEERQLVKLVEKMPLPVEEKEPWLEQIRGGEMSDDLAETIRQKLVAGTEGEDNQSNRARYLVELTTLVKRWRLSSQARNFGRR